jgi:uncharacterized damage-inducible protein DinB
MCEDTVSDPRVPSLLGPLRLLFAYDAWANEEVVRGLKRGPCPEHAVALMAHIVAADRLWLDRLKRQRQRMPVWPTLALEECRQATQEVAREWHALWDELSEPMLSEPREYVNTKGEAWSSAVGDMLLHVLLHSAYHRGQIASVVRGAGGEPAYTDYVHAVRQRFVASAVSPA